MTNWTLEEQKQHRKDWVEALRSGEYKQGVSGLKSIDGKFCSLGVAEDLRDPNGWQTYPEYNYCSIDNNAMYMSREGREYYGLRTCGGSFDIDGAKNGTSLAYLNDNGRDFNYIADIIESEPDGLFEP